MTSPASSADGRQTICAADRGSALEALRRQSEPSMLTREGYRVWCARFPVLGGERYPFRIESAIITGAFCVLVLLSRAALSNPAAAKDRSLALALSRQNPLPHLIGLVTEAVEPVQLMSVAPDLAVISFVERWESGAEKLLGALRTLETPRPLPNGERIAHEGRQFLASRRSWHTVL
jgi:hypothetical protein